MAKGDVLGTFWINPMPPMPRIGIVATEGAVGDWAAYIGLYFSYKGDTHVESETSSIRLIIEYGHKLDQDTARRFFPDITLPYRH